MGTFKDKMTRKDGIFTARFIIEVPGNLSVQCRWAELLGTEMAEKVNDVSGGKWTGLEPAPVAWKKLPNLSF